MLDSPKEGNDDRGIILDMPMRRKEKVQGQYQIKRGVLRQDKGRISIRHLYRNITHFAGPGGHINYH